ILTSGEISFDYKLRIVNNCGIEQTFYCWCNATKPSGAVTTNKFETPFALTLDPWNIVTIGPLTQAVPDWVSMGVFKWNGYAGYTLGGYAVTQDYVYFQKVYPPPIGDNSGEWPNSFESDQTTEILTQTLPADFAVADVSPNPFNPTTTISFTLPEAVKVKLTLYDISGRQVAELTDGWREAGMHEVTFDGSGLVSGVYLYTLEAGPHHASGKMVLMK
ncbi:MAG: T9SS type A sorting domain-containing protein, partial [bacterium]